MQKSIRIVGLLSVLLVVGCTAAAGAPAPCAAEDAGASSSVDCADLAAACGPTCRAGIASIPCPVLLGAEEYATQPSTGACAALITSVCGPAPDR